jgi:NADH-quinone oxidoreductase subunit M
MEFLHRYWLTVVIFLPLVGVIPVALVRGRSAVRWIALSFTLASLAASLLLLFLFDWHKAGPYAYAAQGGVVQLSQRADWIRSAHIQYLVGIDGLSLPLIILTALVFVLACATAWDHQEHSKRFLILLLSLETSLLGTLASLDFVLLFIFMQLSAILLAFLIARRRCMLYSWLMLASAAAVLIVLVQLRGIGTFDLVRLASLNATMSRQKYLLLLFAFLVRMGAPPLHGWLVTAQDRAPWPIGMILAVIIPALGAYGILRVAYPLFPQAARVTWLLPAILGVAAMIYASLCALGQRDARRLTAYSTIAGLGFFLLGTAMFTPASVNGAVFVLVSVGLSGAALTAALGNGERPMTPIRRGFTMLAVLSVLACPGTCGFIGQIMVLIGSFGAAHHGSILYAQARQDGNLPRFLLETRILCVAACFAGVLMSAALLGATRGLFTGPPQQPESPDLYPREISILVTLAALIILLGILPILLWALTSQTVTAIMRLPH